MFPFLSDRIFRHRFSDKYTTYEGYKYLISKYLRLSAGSIRRHERFMIGDPLASYSGRADAQRPLPVGCDFSQCESYGQKTKLCSGYV
jgi:hypothetical protein